MKGVLRAAWLFIGGNRIQRALLAAVPTLQGLVILWAWLDPASLCCVPVAAIVLDAVSLMCLIGCLLIGSVAFRALAAQRVLQFIPFARVGLLLGVLLASALLAGLLTLYAALAHEFSPGFPVPSGNVYGTFFGALELMVLWVLWGFFMFGRGFWLRWLLVLAAFPALLVLGMQYRGIVRAHGSGVIAEFAVIAVVLVLPFVTWYLSTRLIEPLASISNDRDSFVVFGRRFPQVFEKSAAVATNVYLLGHPSVWRACSLLMLCYAGLNLLVLCLMRSLGHVDPSRAYSLVIGCVIGCGSPYPDRIVRRARTMWIRACSSRRELFKQVEKLSLRCFAFGAIPILVVGAAELTHLSVGRVAYLLLLAVSSGLCCVYLTLLDMRFRNYNHVMVLDMAIFGVTCLFLLPDSQHFLFEQSGSLALLLVPLAEFLAVLLLRAIAVHRWQRIDWLNRKLPKPASQRLRLAR